MDDDKLIVCRCEEVTLGEIKEAVKDGARSVSGVKMRTRACMGMCQGRVCQPLVLKVLARETDTGSDGPARATVRPPVRPVLIGEITSDRRTE
ncbi:MAG: (2Fe-2S)-binding protein [Bacillota bacterium]